MNDLAQCPLCKQSKFSQYLSCKDHTVSSETFQLRQCVGCGFVVTSPRPDEAMLPGYYQSKKYISHTDSSSGLVDKVYQIARTFTVKWKYNIIRKHSSVKPGSVLDFGCGTGSFLKYCQNKGLKTAGVEPSNIAREKAEQILGQPIVPELPQIREKFDAITLWHVLEHVYHLDVTLSTLKERLNENGTIFIAVPNLKSIDAHHYGEDWAAFDVQRHLWHFSKETMERLLNNHNLKLREVLPMRLDAFYVSLLSEKYKNGHKGVSNLSHAIRVGLKSNNMAKITGEYSSLIYIGHP